MVNATGRDSYDAIKRVDSGDLAPTPVDTARLLSVEARTLPQTLVEGPRQYDTLPEYYWGANPSLLARLNRAKAAFDCVPPPTFHALTLVVGTAGVGKTFIKGTVFGKQHPASALCKFDVRELYDSWRDDEIVSDRPDLHDGRLVLNTLPAVSDKSRPHFREYLEASDASFYVIDSLDEVHPDDYTWILRQIRDFVANPRRRFVHVVVFSRPFALRDDWKAASAAKKPLDARLYRLAPPEFYTTGDLRVSSWNYHCWKNKLSWQPKGDELQSMPLEAYAQWAELDFPNSGQFASVTARDDSSTRTEVDAALNRCAKESPVICGVLRNLAGNSMVREILEQRVANDASYDEREVMEACLHAWLARESRVDNRPSEDNAEHLELYLRILEQVAARALYQDGVDDWGYFPVRERDRVTVTHGGRTYSFLTVRVLNHSGLVDVECRGSGVTKCRFEPIWMHRLLVEMHNERVSDGGNNLRLISQTRN
jgi:hypothetical protein